MIKKIRKFIFIILLLVTLYGFLTAGIDNYRMSHGNNPIFSSSTYTSKNRTQTYKGLFYQASRKIRVSIREPISESSNVKFYFLGLKAEVPESFKEKELDYTIETEKSETCTPSTLYYADTKLKIYTYCLDNIQIKRGSSLTTLKDEYLKDNSFIDDIDSHLNYIGLHNDLSTLIFHSREDGFANNGLTMYRCNKKNINDVYLVPKDTAMQSDFCTYKDDDFKFIFEVLEEITEVYDENGDLIEIPEEEKQPEVFYEDETYRYEFSEPKLEYTYVTTPAVRGKNATKTPLKTILENKLLTIDELAAKGLDFNKIDKAKEAEELAKQKAAEEKAKQEQESKEKK